MIYLNLWKQACHPTLYAFSKTIYTSYIITSKVQVPVHPLHPRPQPWPAECLAVKVCTEGGLPFIKWGKICAVAWGYCDACCCEFFFKKSSRIKCTLRHKCPCRQAPSSQASHQAAALVTLSTVLAVWPICRCELDLRAGGKVTTDMSVGN